MMCSANRHGIQFWKRKWVEVDGNGSLVLSNSRGTDVSLAFKHLTMMTN